MEPDILIPPITHNGDKNRKDNSYILDILNALSN